jgi:hypothetical protein
MFAESDEIHRNANTKILKRNIAKLKGTRTQKVVFTIKQKIKRH